MKLSAFGYRLSSPQTASSSVTRADSYPHVNFREWTTHGLVAV